jgi:hypothetical protein
MSVILLFKRATGWSAKSTSSETISRLYDGIGVGASAVAAMGSPKREIEDFRTGVGELDLERAIGTLRTPASICLIESGAKLLGSATLTLRSSVRLPLVISPNLPGRNRAAANAMIALPKKLRRS